MYVKSVAFEDKNFMNLKKRVQERDGQCSCPPIDGAVTRRLTASARLPSSTKVCPMDKLRRERFLQLENNAKP